ncbi:cyclophilin-like fold protein [Leifsonia sp. 1010]|uniref:cyclophilin-like fold protein n=1 Tax=Leifsonia sp. 1010 TaxID=2817769 RepID=UPI00286643F4|nr:cyclophilin-like fold protein [Leifsonia sp. 1010]MDR6611928.1 hypothetical protein [Leifsonia sp. 1010]
MHRRTAGAAATIFILTVATGCTASPASHSPTPLPTAGSPGPSALPSPTDTRISEAPVPGTRISITVDGQTLTGTLDHNSTASALLEQLPLELTLRDFGGQEKVADLPSALPLEGMPAGSAASPGTIGYYAPDQVIVLYYEHVGYYPGIIPIGTFDDVSAVWSLVDGARAVMR